MEFKYEGRSLEGGVYKITNTQNGRIYYGSAKGFKQRWYGHANSLKTNRHRNKFLQADFNKCGEDVFVFEVVEVVEGDRKKRLQTEEVYLKKYFDHGKNCYNLCDRAISREGFKSKNPEETHKKKSLASKKMWENSEYREKVLKSFSGNRRGKRNSPEAIKKIKEARAHQIFTEETRQKMGNARRGTHCSEEAKRKIGEKNSKHMVELWQSQGYREKKIVILKKSWENLERRKRQSEMAKKQKHVYNPRFTNTGCKHSNETKRKISEGNSKRVAQYTLEGLLIKIFPSVQIAQKETGIFNISETCYGRRNKAGGYKWTFVFPSLKGKSNS